MISSCQSTSAISTHPLALSYKTIKYSDKHDWSLSFRVYFPSLNKTVFHPSHLSSCFLSMSTRESVKKTHSWDTQSLEYGRSSMIICEIVFRSLAEAHLCNREWLFCQDFVIFSRSNYSKNFLLFLIFWKSIGIAFRSTHNHLMYFSVTSIVFPEILPRSFTEAFINKVTTHSKNTS